MILVFDTYYFDNKAKTVCLAIESWETEEKYTVYTEILENIAEYESGEFYKRELPCILSLLEKMRLENVEIEAIETIIIDGFVFLDDNKELGMGGHLYEKLGCKIPIIGVAKSNFARINEQKKTIFRGKSIKPLYITAAGIDLNAAAISIENSRGMYRIPNLLKQLDILTKEKIDI